MNRCIQDFNSKGSADFDCIRDNVEQFTFAATYFSNIDNTFIELYKYFDDAVNIYVPRYRPNLPPLDYPRYFFSTEKMRLEGGFYYQSQQTTDEKKLSFSRTILRKHV